MVALGGGTGGVTALGQMAVTTHLYQCLPSLAVTTVVFNGKRDVTMPTSLLFHPGFCTGLGNLIPGKIQLPEEKLVYAKI